MKSAHNLDVKGLQCVPSGLDKVNTCMDAIVDNIHAVDLVLGVQVCIKSLVNVVHDWPPRFVVVHKVAESRCINNGQAKTNAVLFDISADGFD
jgi:hypothetical protein